MARLELVELLKGAAVHINGFPGTISEVCDGYLEGMVVVQLKRGFVCVSADEVEPDPKVTP